AGPPGWPDPLGSRVLARQRAYETLFRLPVERKARLARPTTAPPAMPPPAAPLPPADGPSPSPAALAHGRRRTSLLAGATAVALCLTTAGVYVLTRQDTPAAAHSPGSAASGPAGSGPGGTAPAPSRGAGSGTSTEGGSAASPDGSTGDTSAPLATASPSPSAPATTTTAAPPAGPGTSTGPTPAPSSPTAEPATAPWNADCTHYSGSGRTRQGDTGKRVLQVQCMLSKRGYGIGDSGADGIFGSGTETAVRGFQSDKGLTVDGIVGHDTWTALRGES
ncbi:peptidoglycan-binding domain-containing protein, partial [Streptomyces bobili]|uniref:peptidoglycan-binding domain-containing protein n=1 Tax=Streptomyces bobili TaxID=67280 RepID=UPI00343F48D0